MLSIGAMKGGQGQYYIELAKEDYYMDGGEPPGKWLGRGAEELGLTGTVSKEAFHHAFQGFAPDGKKTLVQNAGEPGHRPGWDVTFSAPKSVSVLWSQADEATRKIIQDAHHAAVKAALSYLEENAAITRRGKGGIEQEKAGLVIATFEHGTSRAQEPQLHTHALVLNIGTRADGTTGTLESKPIYEHGMAAGALYRAELAMQLEQRLGVEVERQRTWFEVKGVSKTLIETFSTRRREIEEALKEKGLDSAKAAEIAALDTRGVKGHIARSDLFAKWQEVGQELGFGREEITKLLGRVRPERSVALEKEASAKDALTRLTEQQSYFSKRQFIRATAEEAQARGIGAKQILEAAKETLANSREIVRLGNHRGEELFTTHAILREEERILTYAAESREDISHLVRERTIAAVLHGRPTIGEEQEKALRHITQQPGSVKVVSGMAGTGKTFLLDAAREAWEKEGYQVLGCALAGKAADGLQEGAHIQSFTIAKLLYDLGNSRRSLTSKTVLVVDEAGMVDTRQMGQLVEAVRNAGAKFVLVGDEKQLQAIGRGGAFAAIAEQIGSARLTDIIRQREGWAREAVHDFAGGRAGKALRTFAEKGLLHVAEDRQDAMRALIQAWKQEGVTNAKENLILTGLSVEAVTLNRMAQAARKQAGELNDQFLTVDGERIYGGDRILFTLNSTVLGVRRGTLGEVVQIDEVRRTLKVKLDNGERTTVALAHYDHLKLGYAMTTHKGQGATVENAYVLAGGVMQDRETTYVQASRTKGQTRIFTDEIQTGEQLATLIRQASKSRKKEMATTFNKQVPPRFQPDGQERDQEQRL